MRGIQNWGAGAEEREERLRRQNQDYLDEVRKQMEEQKAKRRREGFAGSHLERHIWTCRCVRGARRDRVVRWSRFCYVAKCGQV